MTALDIRHSTRLVDLDEQIARVEWEAAKKQSGSTASSDFIGQRFSEIRYSIVTRLNAHNFHGSGLNYGERVTYLRLIYADSVRLVYERLYSAWAGLQRFFGISMPPPPWWGGAESPLEALVIWVRTAIEVLDVSANEEQIYDLYLLLGEHLVGDKDWVASELQNTSDKDFSFPFKLSLEKLGILDEDYAVRLLGLGMTVTTDSPEAVYQTAAKDVTLDPKTYLHVPFNFRFPMVQQFRGLSSFEAFIDLPQQQCEGPPPNKTQRFWNIPTLRYQGIAPWLQGGIKESAPILNAGAGLNCDPIGRWGLRLSKSVILAGRTVSLKDWSIHPENDELTPRLSLPLTDIVLGMRVAVRKRQTK